MSMHGEGPPLIPAEQVRLALERALAAPVFASKRRGELLRYLVERALSGAGCEISEYSIALDVFGKPQTFDPRKESTVRAEMSRVRKALADYYGSTGSAETWRFEFPAGGYAPAFVRCHQTAPAKPKTVPRHWFWAAALIAVAAMVAWLPAVRPPVRGRPVTRESQALRPIPTR